ncbi:unnamed protein product [Rhizophagus irregularis]|nr:unnamed protein product [Rhizophagus irregularis]
MADSETDQEEMEEEIDEENNGDKSKFQHFPYRFRQLLRRFQQATLDESEVSEVEEDEENDTRLSNCNTNKRSSTTGLSNHLKSKHNITKNQEKNQLTIHEVINNSEAIIVKNDLPFTCVESEDFRSMIRLLRKDAFIPSADTIKNDIISIFDESKKKINSILQNISKKISFMINGWTSSNNISFLGITVHLITNEWKLKSFLLDFIKLDGPHSGANIKEAFLKSLSSYNIESNILGVTTDNASNNITFLQAVENELSKKFIRFESKDKHVRCLAHVMNLAAQQALTMLKAIEDNEPSNQNSGGSLIHKLRTLIKKIKASPQQQEKFKAQCKVANISNLNVILDVRTRWNLTHDMLMRARTLKEPINTLSNSDQNLRALSINEEKWVHLSEIEELLKEAAINAINKLKKYYNKTDTTLYTVSLILDSRLKLEYMKDNEWEKCWIDKTKNDI